jgi:hypothetical protein
MLKARLKRLYPFECRHAAAQERRPMMKRSLENARRQLLGRVSTETKGPPGFHMEASGLWNKEGLGS